MALTREKLATFGLMDLCECVEIPMVLKLKRRKFIYIKIRLPIFEPSMPDKCLPRLQYKIRTLIQK